MTAAATTGGALKQYIESLGLSLSAHRDQAPAGAKPPYCVILEGQALVPSGLLGGGGYGGGGTAGAQVAVEQVQVDLYQLWHDTKDQPAENYALVRKLVRLLHGAPLDQAPERAYLTLVVDARRLPLELEVEVTDANGLSLGKGLVHHAITLSIHQQL